jgi:hypothetical protein
VKWPPAWDPVVEGWQFRVQYCTGGCEEESFKSAAVERRLYVCDMWSVSFNETVIVPVLQSVARIRLEDSVID